MKFFIGLVIFWSSTLLFITNGIAATRIVTICSAVASPSKPNENYYCTYSYERRFDDGTWFSLGTGYYYSPDNRSGTQEFDF